MRQSTVQDHIGRKKHGENRHHRRGQRLREPAVDRHSRAKDAKGLDDRTLRYSPRTPGTGPGLRPARDRRTPPSGQSHRQHQPRKAPRGPAEDGPRRTTSIPVEPLAPPPARQEHHGTLELAIAIRGHTDRLAELVRPQRGTRVSVEPHELAAIGNSYIYVW